MAMAASCPRGAFTGKVTHVRDGDTIEVGGLPIRLNGLAAPERGEPGGPKATAAMLELVPGRTLRCELDGEHTHDRCVGVCYLDGTDIAAVMVRRGLARNCPVQRRPVSRGGAAGWPIRRTAHRLLPEDGGVAAGRTGSAHLRPSDAEERASTWRTWSGGP
jgi:endonuclease YncB( thermonuclease family)